MPSWRLTKEAARRLLIAADARQGTVDYAEDQIWALSLAGGDPPALALETTYGLRVPSMRLFSSVNVDGQHALDPANFIRPPEVLTIYPNYLLVHANPLVGIQLRQEYWVQDSHSVVGRVEIINRRETPIAFDLRLHAVLRPGPGGVPFSPGQIDGVHVLTAEIERLSPLIFIEGGAGTPPSAFPSLGVSANLGSGRSRSWTWAHVGEREQRTSFDKARRLCGLPWEANIARIKMLNAGLVEVETGDPEWDIAFWLTQVAGLQAFSGPTRHFRHPGIVGRRRPADGYSPAGDGRDYNGAWAGVDAASAYHICKQVLIAAPELVEGELRNRLQTEIGSGSFDGQPGLGGQRAGWETMPLLVDLASKIHTRTGSDQDLAEIYPALLQSVRSWFDEERDRDGDGFPEWRHMPQSGFRAWPTYVGWARWGQGLDLSLVERPDLAAYLYRELSRLAEIANIVSDARALDWLDSTAQRLKDALESCWVEKSSIFVSRDRDLNTPLVGERLARGKGSFQVEIDRSFDDPVRVLIRCFGDELKSKEIKVTVRGKGSTNRRMVERFSHASFQWFWKMGSAVAGRPARAVNLITVDGLDDSFTTEIRLVDTHQQDVAGILPLWAGMIEANRASRMVKQTVMDGKRFWRAFGIPAVSARETAYAPGREGNPGALWMFANGLVGEGMLKYGFWKETAELVGRLMKAVITGLQHDQDFSALYHPDKAESLGECGSLDGLAPLDLFLATLGLQLGDPYRVQVKPGNPYPWPVTIRWRGLSVAYKADQVTITFPDGGLARVSGEGKTWIEQDRD